MQGSYTGGPFGVYSMAQSKSPYSAVKINGSLLRKACLSEFRTLKKLFENSKNKIPKAMM